MVEIVEVTNENPRIGSSNTSRFVDSRSGVQVVRSGQTVYMSFLDAVQASYSNLVYNPAVLMWFVFTLAMVFAEYNNSTGPVEIVIKLLEKVMKDEKAPIYTKELAKWLLFIFQFLAKYKNTFMSLSLVWIPYFFKPSTKNMIFSVGLSALVIIAYHWSVLEILLLSQLWFLFTEMRAPHHKLIIATIGIAIFVFGAIDISDTRSSATASPPIESVNRQSRSVKDRFNTT